MNKFKSKDEQGKDIFFQYCNKRQWCRFNKKSIAEYTEWDVSYYSGETKVIGEIKLRDNNMNDYPDWILEWNKLSKLKIKQEAHEGSVIQYINIFNDGNILIWDITDLDLNDERFKMKYLRRTTMSKSGGKDKLIIGLRPDEAILKELI